MKNYFVVDVETTGLNPMENRIVAIGITDGKENTIIMYEDEKQTLSEFWDYLNEKKADVLVGFNFDFDWQFLKLRSLKHRIKIKHFQKYKERYDLRQILNPDKYKKGTKLSDYLHFLDIPNGDKYDGSMIPEFWENKEYEKISEHLLKDIVSEYELFKIMKECGVYMSW